MYEIRDKKTSQLIEAVNGHLTFEKNKPALLTFSLYPNSDYYENLESYISEVIVFDGNKKVFDGQVISVDDGMDSTGIFNYNVCCIDRLDYLNRTKTGRWDIHPGAYQNKDENIPESEINDPYIIKQNITVKKYVELMLSNHNSKVADNRKIYLGSCDINDGVTCTADREITLTELQTLAEKNDAYMELYEDDEGKLKLDFLQNINKVGSKLEKGINITSLDREGSLDTIITRIIPLGKENLTIKSVNNNIEYIEDTSLKAKYGTIEEVVKFDDITVASNLLTKAKKYLATVNDNSYSISISSKDLSYINQDFSKFEINQECEIYINSLGLYQKHRIIKVEIDIDTPYNSSLTFSKSSQSLMKDTVMQKKELENALKKVEKTNYDNNAFKISTNNTIDLINKTYEREKIYRIMGVM